MFLLRFASAEDMHKILELPMHRLMRQYEVGMRLGKGLLPSPA